MNSTSNETNDSIRQSVREFSKINIAPYAAEWDEQQIFPKHLFHQLGDLGLMGMLVPTELGGAGLGYEEYVTAIIELSKADPSVGLSMAAHNSLCCNHILMFGTKQQKEKYLPLLATGKHIGAWGLTEPGTGSDAGNMATTARKAGKDWILNGNKCFITNAIGAEIAVVIARTGAIDDKHGATAFIIEKGADGYKTGKKLNKLGMRASETAELFFEDCRIPDEQRLGNIGEGFIQSLKILDGGRISIAALSLGIALGAYETALTYARQREQFGKPISSFQAIAFKLADMYTDIQASLLLTTDAAVRKDRNENVTLASSVAKYHASETAVRVSGEAVQILGGYGFTKEFPAERYFRDSKLCTIGEGTSEIQKLVISREILKQS